MGFVEDSRFLDFGARCVFFDRYGGVSRDPFSSLNVSFNVGDDRVSVEKNLDIIKNILNVNNIGVINQVHSDIIVEYNGNLYDADGLYTKKRDIFLGVRFADCVPIVFMDTTKMIIMVVHAGWRGSYLGIAKKAVAKFIGFGSDLSDILVSIGPHICDNCYEIKRDVAKKFNYKFIKQKNDNMFLDLESANIHQIIDMGIPIKNIKSMDVCTYENDRFFSYRRDGVCGRNIGGIVINS